MARHSGGGHGGGCCGGGRSGADEAGSSSANRGRRRHRGINLRLFDRPLAVLQICDVDAHSHHILTPTAKGTLYAICLSLLPTRCMRFTQYAQYDPSFIETVLREFHTNYMYAEGVSQADGDAVVTAHVAKNYSGWLYEIRQRAFRDVEDQPGSSLRDHQPQIVSDAAWEAMCKYKDDEDFKKKS